MMLEGCFCWTSCCDLGPHGCVCGNDCRPVVPEAYDEQIRAEERGRILREIESAEHSMTLVPDEALNGLGEPGKQHYRGVRYGLVKAAHIARKGATR